MTRWLHRAFTALWRSHFALWPCLAFAAAEKGPEHAVLWTGGMTPARVAYEIPVVKLALEKSREKYGDYTFGVSSQLLSTQRVERALRDGDAVNIVSSPIWAMNSAEESLFTIIPIPIAKGLLGYRRNVVRKEKLPEFEAVETLEDLRGFTAGLGISWTELDVFRSNKLNWYGGKDIEQLHSMLHRSRFDYVPLGVVEAEESLENSAYHDELAIVPNLIVYYPLPIFIQVSVSKPLLAERLEYGLKQAIADGTLEALFNQHYGPLVNKLRSQPTRVIVLHNPNLPEFVKDSSPRLLKH